MSSQYIMAIDQGTTGTTVSILNHGGGLVAKVNQEYPQIFPKPGWVEHNPEDIWKSVMATIKSALEQSHLTGLDIAAIGITNQRETVVVWDKKTMAPVYNAIVWQCRRTQDFCEQLKKEKLQTMISKKTGLVLDPYFSASKIRWILKNVNGANQKAKQGQLICGNVDSYLLFRLTDGKSFYTDVSNASRTMLMNLQTLQWDKDLLKLFGVYDSMLPEIVESNFMFGHTKNLGVLPDGIPITGIAGDQQAALFGQTCFSAGEAKCTFGTGSFLLMNTGQVISRSKNKLLTTVAWKLKNQKPFYALEGGAFICGAAVQWLRDGLGLIKKSSEVESLARQVEDSAGVEFVPALAGLGAPYWVSEARGVLCGLTRGTNKSHIARATLEAMALQNVEILQAMQQDLGKKMKSLRVDGGAVGNDLLMQMQANYLGVKVERPKQVESTSIGAGYLAGLGAGFWESQNELKKIWSKDNEFGSLISGRERDLRMKKWRKAVQRALI